MTQTKRVPKMIIEKMSQRLDIPIDLLYDIFGMTEYHPILDNINFLSLDELFDVFKKTNAGTGIHHRIAENILTHNSIGDTGKLKLCLLLLGEDRNEQGDKIIDQILADLLLLYFNVNEDREHKDIAELIIKHKRINSPIIRRALSMIYGWLSDNLNDVGHI